MRVTIHDPRSTIHGFTLVEVMLAVAILLVTGLVIFSTTIAGHRALAVNQAAVLATQQARQAIGWITRDLQRTPVSQITDGTGVDSWPPDTADGWSSIRFRYPEQVDSDGVVSDWSDYIAYVVSEGQLLRLEGGLPGGGARLNSGTEIAMALRGASGAWAGSAGYLVIAMTMDELSAGLVEVADPGTIVDDPDGGEVLAGGGGGSGPTDVAGLAFTQGTSENEVQVAIAVEARQAGPGGHYALMKMFQATVWTRND